MINTNPAIRPMVTPSAVKLTSGVHGGNIHEVSENLAQDSATVLGSLDRPMKTDLARDVKALKTQLWARLGDKQMHHALMTAGALLGGPHGVVLTSLHQNLKATLASPQKLDELAGKVEKFNGGDQPKAGAVYDSLNSQVTGGLVGAKVGGENVPAATFLAGALANAYQDQGGYNLAR
jgi:hypothetical protein